MWLALRNLVEEQVKANFTHISFNTRRELFMPLVTKESSCIMR